MSTTATIAPTGTWTVDATHSRIGFAARPFPLTMSSFTSFRGGAPVGFSMTGLVLVSSSCASASAGEVSVPDSPPDTIG